MDFDGFDWDRGNRDKCQTHGVPLAEIEAIFDRPVLIVEDTESSAVEQRFRAVGTTSEGRKVFVVFTMRGSRLRLSARYMHRKEIDRYEKDNP